MNTQSTPRSLWPYAIIAFFIALAVFNGVVLALALRDRSTEIESNPFETGQKYEEVIDAKRSALRDNIVSRINGEDGRVSVEVHGLKANGSYRATIEILRPNDTSQDLRDQISQNGGILNYTSPQLTSGLWLVSVDIKTDNASYRFGPEKVFVKTDPAKHARRLSGMQFVDHTGLVPEESVKRTNELLAALLRDTDVELVALTVPNLGGTDIDSYTDKLFEEWEVGARTRGTRGVLFVMAQAEQKVRLEVGYGLEAIFPDVFVAYIEREQMKPYFDRNMVGHGIEATIEMIAGRGFQSILKGELDPQVRESGTLMDYRSGGAGANTGAIIGGESPGSTKQNLPDDIRSYFSAQPTAELAWQRFLEVNKRRISDPELGLYDKDSRALLRTRPYTNAALDSIARLYTGKHYLIREKLDRAAVIFPEDSQHLLAPWFFRKTSEGWQFDGPAFFDCVRFNHLNQWHFAEFPEAYKFAFDGFRFDKHGFAFKGK